MVAVLVVLSPHSLRPYVLGAGLASAFWYVVLMVVVMSGTGSYLLGSYGEQWTSEALRKLERHGWRLLEHLPLEYGDIDHVLVGPGGVYAVETKNTSGLWDLDEPDERLRDALEQARRCADRLRVLLLERSVRVRTEVRPLVVLWGRASSRVATLEGVDVVHGPDLSLWKESLGTNLLTPEQIETAFAWLRRYIEMRDTDIEKKQGRLPMLVDIGPLAILSRTYRCVLGFLAALIALGAGVKVLGNGLVIPVLLVWMAAGIFALRYERARHLAFGWVAASVATWVVFLSLVMLTWTGWI